MNNKPEYDTYIFLILGMIMILVSFYIIVIQSIHCDVSQIDLPECLCQFGFKYLPNIFNLNDYYFSTIESFVFMFLMCMGWYLFTHGLIDIMVYLGIIEPNEKIKNI